MFQDLSDTAEVLALKASLLERLGRSAEARNAAERALHGGVEARAEGQMTLGRLELSRARYEEAAKCFRRAAALYSATNEGTNRAEALNNEAVARSRAGEEAKEAFEELLTLVQDNQALRALALLNLGKEHELREELEQAVEVYQGAVPLAEEAGALDVAARLWNNLGVCFEAREPGRARAAYRQALELARQTGERRIIGVTLANLAALEENFEAWEEAMHLLAAAEHFELVEAFHEQLPEAHPFRRRPEVKM